MPRIRSPELAQVIMHRYYSYRWHAIPIAFPTNVDPKGHLKRAGGSTYVRLADNVVEYHGKEQTVVNNELVDDFQPIGPASFTIGQIVKAQVTFAMIPTSATKRKLLVTPPDDVKFAGKY
ncbi:hypothetical protein BD410DRAFT_846733 [Rickenella mellea]|uniref:Uncharacterized protein n=1 Tax=Rickenella mellea TaxID=50990 RepID=A0A4Y7PGK1_9AGAM|nr:hypothetical protein BD410DRAFT_846733 [Rickenella mellea]